MGANGDNLVHNAAARQRLVLRIPPLHGSVKSKLFWTSVNFCEPFAHFKTEKNMQAALEFGKYFFKPMNEADCEKATKDIDLQFVNIVSPFQKCVHNCTDKPRHIIGQNH